MKIINYIENRKYRLNDFSEWIIPEEIEDTIKSDIFGIENFPKVDVNPSENTWVVLTDEEIMQTEEYKLLMIQKKEQEQYSKSSHIIAYNFDKIKETILKSDFMEKKIKENFENYFIDTLKDFSNIDIENSSNVNFDTEKQLIQVIDKDSPGLILTIPLQLQVSKVCLLGEGMIPEYNWGMIVEVSNDGGANWFVLNFNNPNISDTFNFSTQSNGTLLLRMVLQPKAIYPEMNVLGKAYITSFAILY